ncbi:MAG TPA: hypothetical protein VF094_08475 [Gaiellaceae bacterium]
MAIPQARIFLQPVAAPAVLGYFALCSALMIWGSWFAQGWGTEKDPSSFFPFQLLFGGVGQLAAALWSYRARAAVSAALHGSWAAFFLGLALIYLLATTHTITVPARGAEWQSLGQWLIYLSVVTWTTAFADCRAAPSASSPRQRSQAAPRSRRRACSPVPPGGSRSPAGCSSARVYLTPIAPPVTLGLFGFFASTMVVSTWILGWWGTAKGSPPTMFEIAAMFGGVAQFAAGPVVLPRARLRGLGAADDVGDVLDGLGLPAGARRRPRDHGSAVLDAPAGVRDLVRPARAVHLLGRGRCGARERAAVPRAGDGRAGSAFVCAGFWAGSPTWIKVGAGCSCSAPVSPGTPARWCCSSTRGAGSSCPSA